MKSEISAGGIVVRKKGKLWEVLVLRDMNDMLTFPKGLIEKGETPLTAAIREIHEEVGLTELTKLTKLPVIGYVYRRGGVISKTVHYFLFLLSGRQVLRPQKEEGIHGVRWMPIGKAIEAIGYEKTNKPLLEEAQVWILHRHRILKKS